MIAKAQNQGQSTSTTSTAITSPKMLTDDTGAVAWRASYDAYGEAQVTNSTLGSNDFNIRFPGQYWDEETGLHYNRFRYYAPALGRYVSADPIGQLAGSNVYIYVQNSPVDDLDPLGLNNFGGPLFQSTNPNAPFYRPGSGSPRTIGFSLRGTGGLGVAGTGAVSLAICTNSQGQPSGLQITGSSAFGYGTGGSFALKPRVPLVSGGGPAANQQFVSGSVGGIALTASSGPTFRLTVPVGAVGPVPLVATINQQGRNTAKNISAGIGTGFSIFSGYHLTISATIGSCSQPSSPCGSQQ